MFAFFNGEITHENTGVMPFVSVDKDELHSMVGREVKNVFLSSKGIQTRDELKRVRHCFLGR